MTYDLYNRPNTINELIRDAHPHGGTDVVSVSSPSGGEGRVEDSIEQQLKMLRLVYTQPTARVLADLATFLEKEGEVSVARIIDDSMLDFVKTANKMLKKADTPPGVPDPDMSMLGPGKAPSEQADKSLTDIRKEFNAYLLKLESLLDEHSQLGGLSFVRNRQLENYTKAFSKLRSELRKDSPNFQKVKYLTDAIASDEILDGSWKKVLELDLESVFGDGQGGQKAYEEYKAVAKSLSALGDSYANKYNDKYTPPESGLEQTIERENGMSRTVDTDANEDRVEVPGQTVQNDSTEIPNTPADNTSQVEKGTDVDTFRMIEIVSPYTGDKVSFDVVSLQNLGHEDPKDYVTQLKTRGIIPQDWSMQQFYDNHAAFSNAIWYKVREKGLTDLQANGIKARYDDVAKKIKGLVSDDQSMSVFEYAKKNIPSIGAQQDSVQNMLSNPRAMEVFKNEMWRRDYADKDGWMSKSTMESLAPSDVKTMAFVVNKIVEKYPPMQQKHQERSLKLDNLSYVEKTKVTDIAKSRAKQALQNQDMAAQIEQSAVREMMQVSPQLLEEAAMATFRMHLRHLRNQSAERPAAQVAPGPAKQVTEKPNAQQVPHGRQGLSAQPGGMYD